MEIHIQLISNVKGGFSSEIASIDGGALIEEQLEALIVDHGDACKQRCTAITFSAT